MVTVRLRDGKTIDRIRQKARITDVAEHLARKNGNGHNISWERRTIDEQGKWQNVDQEDAVKIPRRPNTMRKVDIQKIAGTQWISRTADRTKWRQLGEAYVQRWTKIRWEWWCWTVNTRDQISSRIRWNIYLTKYESDSFERNLQRRKLGR